MAQARNSLVGLIYNCERPNSIPSFWDARKGLLRLSVLFTYPFTKTNIKD